MWRVGASLEGLPSEQGTDHTLSSVVWFATTPAMFILETIFVLITPVTIFVLVFLETTLVLVTLETNPVLTMTLETHPVLTLFLETGCVLKVSFKEMTKLSSVFEKMM